MELDEQPYTISFGKLMENPDCESVWINGSIPFQKKIYKVL
jgi:hypothetical protein